ncbi:TadE/TadG family type IV pilus assembly protein [Sphingobium nicotianae]|uniref:Pilus assembly protein n=1 Tax=Sphingobium nicotianae TaxID=2782607 RepID=A0A9X1IT94_9SPHN|nr:TadE/TadG family type IV pilus assembly protein [Sphingobium nicotianae]MBT2189087.1 pilus assembly protein [Sphingobium nicotianae]
MSSRGRLLDPFRSTGGVAAIEFAIISPVLLALIVSVIELGLATRDSLRAQAAAAAGAYYSVQNGFDATGIAAAVVNGTGAPGLSASPAPTLFCGCPSAGGIGPATCDATCDDGAPARKYVRVSASITRTSVLDADLGLPTVITRQSIMRLP